MQKQRLLVMFAESPVHAGGPGAEGSLDLPIQREASTGLPVIWGQSLKGALRDAARDQAWELEVFGSRPPKAALPTSDDSDSTTGEVSPTTPGSDLSPGAVWFGDLQLVAFPAATTRSGFAWTTSRQLLSRLQRKVSLVDKSSGRLLAAVFGAPGVLGTSEWAGKHAIGPFVGVVQNHAELNNIGRFIGNVACPGSSVFDYTRTKLATDLLLLPDEDLTDLSRLGTELLTRIQLNPGTKTVEHGPFHSEHLPAETIMAGVLSAEREEPLLRIQEFFNGRTIQLGGDETIGKGLLWARVLDSKSLADATQAGE